MVAIYFVCSELLHNILFFFEAVQNATLRFFTTFLRTSINAIVNVYFEEDLKKAIDLLDGKTAIQEKEISFLQICATSVQPKLRDDSQILNINKIVRSWSRGNIR